LLARFFFMKFVQKSIFMTNRQLFLQNVAQTSAFPLSIEVEKAEGVYIYDKSTRYIDLISGIAVSNVGHRHPKVVEAIKAQVDRYMHVMVYGEYIQNPQVQLANALVSTLAGTFLDNVYFTNSGTEAVEGAMKLAKRFTGRTEIIACTHAYHGSTQGALSLGEEHFKRNFRPLLPDISKIQRNNYADLSKISQKTAAVIIEPIGGEAGVVASEINFLKDLREKCTQTGTLLIFDEIQSGFGRTGKFWAFEHYDVIPDILLCAKGMGGGMPIGAFIAPKQIMSVLTDYPILGHITTFGGHPVSCAASLATLNVILEEKLMASVEQKSQLFKKLLVHPKIKTVRGVGLMLAVEFESFNVLKPIIDKCLEKGLITDWFLYCDNSMRIAPPLIISEEEIRFACEVILTCLN